MSTLARQEKPLPEKAQPQQTERLTVRMEPATYKALERLAQAHQISVSELAYEALQLLAEEYRQQETAQAPKRYTKRTGGKTPAEALPVPTQAPSQLTVFPSE